MILTSSRMSLKFRVTTYVGLLSLVLLPIVILAPPAGAVTAPKEGVSLYMDDHNTSHLYTFGCQLGSRDSSLPGTQNPVTVLEFGAMVKETTGKDRKSVV